MCRICHCEGEADSPLIAPCLCAGSLKFVHQACLQRWIKSSDTRYCELCKFEFLMKVTTKPFTQWQKLDMSSVERRKIICSVTFHIIALTCVIWSLYVLIERTADEVNTGELQWPFWTKLIVIAIGVTGGLVFMYVQCRVYAALCRRWRSFNRSFLIQSVPEDLLERAQKAAKEKQYAAAAASTAHHLSSAQPSAPLPPAMPPSNSTPVAATTNNNSCFVTVSSLAMTTVSINSGVTGVPPPPAV